MYNSETQKKNIAWFLPRPKPDHYKGGMPLYCEKWLLELAQDILNKKPITVLNLFCGMNKRGVRIDINPEVKPDFCIDIHKLSKYLNKEVWKDFKFDVILADPPYSDDESKQLYGTGKLNYSKWSKEVDKFLRVGGLFIVYHKFIVPNPNPEKYRVEKRVFVGNRVWHLPRIAIYFRKEK